MPGTLKMDKYFVNRTVFMCTLVLLGMIYFSLANFDLALWVKILLDIAIIFLLHFNLNTLHQASHRLLSKNKKLNDIIGHISAILGGVTFAAFQSTHFIHHASTADPEKDPDFKITNSKSFFIIPFKIWYHDVFFWQHQLWQKYSSRKEYLFDRFAQILIVIVLLLTANTWIFLYFWLIPTYVVGFLNGLFLFYFPHYSTKKERQLRYQQIYQSSKFKKRWFSRLSLVCIDISRFYHEKHHQKTQENTNFYPVENYLFDKMRGIKNYLNYTAEFIDINGYLN
jgi:beta-carotene hydroxylase